MDNVSLTPSESSNICSFAGFNKPHNGLKSIFTYGEIHYIVVRLIDDDVLFPRLPWSFSGETELTPLFAMLADDSLPRQFQSFPRTRTAEDIRKILDELQ